MRIDSNSCSTDLRRRPTKASATDCYHRGARIRNPDEKHQSKPAGPEREAATDGHSSRIRHGRSLPVGPKVGTCVYWGRADTTLNNEACILVAEKQLKFSPKERDMIREEINKVLDRGIIRSSNSPWVAQCVRGKKKDVTLRLCIGWQALSKQLIVNSGGLGGIQIIFDELKRKNTSHK